MNTLVAAGFWMFWPTITALIQELTPGEEFIHANTFLLAGVQGGWLIAGSIVGFVYNHIGLGGVLLIDCSTYVVSFLAAIFVRKGKHIVPRPAELMHDLEAAESTVARFGREMREGIEFLKGRRKLVLMGSELGALFGSNDDRRGGNRALERQRVSHRRGRLWLAERRMGHQEPFSARFMRRGHGLGRRPPHNRNLHGHPGHRHEPGATLSWMAVAVLFYLLMGSGRG